MENKIRWLRFSYWVGAVIDFLAAIQMISFIIIEDAGPLYNMSVGSGASLMLGWTFLLIWADRKPVERKGVLIITIFPVILGIMTTQALGYVFGFVPLTEEAPVFLMQIILIVLFSFSYINARGVKVE